MTEHPGHGRRARRDLSRRPSAFRDRPIALLVTIVTLLLVVMGLAQIVRAVEERDSAGGRGTVKRQPVTFAVLACPKPGASGGGVNSQVSMLAAPTATRESTGRAVLTGIAGGGRPPIDQPGGLSVNVSSDKVPAQMAVASEALAPGLTAELVTQAASGGARGLAGASCIEPGNDFYFAGASTTPGRIPKLFLTNVDATSALVDVTLWGPRGPIAAPRVQGVTVPPSRQVVQRLDSVAPGQPLLGIAVRARTGRVAAALHEQDATTATPRGVDWIVPVERPEKSIVIPGVPGQAPWRGLTVWVPGENDANLTVTVVGKDGSFRPAGLDALEARAQTVQRFDLSKVVPGQPMALVISSDQPIVASVQTARAKGRVQEFGFATAAAPLTDPAVIADGRGGSRGSTRLLLSAPGRAAVVQLTPLVGGGGQPQPREVQIPEGRTVEVDPGPRGALGYALIVEPQPGSGPVYAARMLWLENREGPMFTIAPLASGRYTVAIPQVDADVSAILPPLPAEE